MGLTPYAGQERTEKRSERVDLRLTPTQKQTLVRVAAEKRRTVASLFSEFIETLGKEK